MHFIIDICRYKDKKAAQQ